MPSARSLTDRLRRLAPEAFAFGVIGAANTALYLAITYVALPIGAVKATVIATIVTTTLAYFANRYWTYRHHTKTALRREYTLFFGFNLIGMVIQSGAVAVAKYGVGLNEADHKLLIMAVTLGAAGASHWRQSSHRGGTRSAPFRCRSPGSSWNGSIPRISRFALLPACWRSRVIPGLRY